jgi:hypothetical protein
MGKHTLEDLRVLEENLLELELRIGMEGAWAGAEAQLQVEREVTEHVRAELAATQRGGVS